MYLYNEHMKAFGVGLIASSIPMLVIYFIIPAKDFQANIATLFVEYALIYAAIGALVIIVGICQKQAVDSDFVEDVLDKAAKQGKKEWASWDKE